MPQPVVISLLLPCRNGASRLGRTLRSLVASAEACPAGVELLIIDNGSTDRTQDVARESLRSSSVPWRVLTEPRPGKSRALNTGLSAAVGQLCLFTDDDVAVAPHWFKTYAQAWELHGDLAYFGGPIVSEFERDISAKKWLEFAPPSVRGLDLGDSAGAIGGSAPFVGANWGVELGAIRAVGGFLEDLGLDGGGRRRVGEETELMSRLRRAGLGAVPLPGATVRHAVPATKCSFRHVTECWHAAGRADGVLRTGEIAEAWRGGSKRWILKLVLRDLVGAVLSVPFSREYYRRRCHAAYLLGLHAGLGER